MPTPPFPSGDTGTTTTKPPKLPDIAAFVGATVFDSEGNPYVIKTRIDRNMGTVYWMSAPSGRAFYPDAGVWQTATGEIFQFGTEGNIISNRILTASERGGGVAGGGSGSGGASAPAYSSTRQAELDRQAFEAAEAEKTRGYNTAIEKARLEAERIANLRSELNNLRQARISERMAAREQGTTLAGTDPFRTLGMLSARAVQGPTMVDQFKGELAQAASFQEPMLGPGASVADLESAIAELAQPITPQGGASSPFRLPGLEHGGTVHKDEVEPFSMGRPHPKTAIEFAKKAGMTTVITGERSGGPELVIGKEFTVIPLSDEEEEELMNGPFNLPGALHGGTITGAGGAAHDVFGAAGSGPNFGLEGLQDLLTGLREQAGFSGWGPTSSTGDIFSRSQAASLGALQRPAGTLLTAQGDPTVYEVDETGRLRAYTSNELFQQSGRSGSNVQWVRPEELAQFERGAPITSPFSIPTSPVGAQGAFGSPLNTLRGFQELFRAQGLPENVVIGEAQRLANLIGFLPTPRRVGRLFDRLQPAQQDALLSAWRLSGIPVETALAQIGRSGITGRARTGVFTG